MVKVTISLYVGTCRHGKQRCVAIPTGHRENKESLFSESDAGYEH